MEATEIDSDSTEIDFDPTEIPWLLRKSILTLRYFRGFCGNSAEAAEIRSELARMIAESAKPTKTALQKN